MRKDWLAPAAAVLFLAGCRGEPVPRDYQNAPPAMTHSPKTSSQTPTANGMPGAAPEPSKGAEGPSVAPDPKAPQNAPSNAPANDTANNELGPPPQNSQHVTQTTSTAVTGTHLAKHP